MLSKWPPKKLNWLVCLFFPKPTGWLVACSGGFLHTMHVKEAGKCHLSIVDAANTAQDFLQDSPDFLHMVG